MAWIKMIAEDEADGELKALYDKILDPVSGHVDHVLAIHSLHPEGLAGHYALYRAVMASSPTLRKVEREMIALVVSRINDCYY
jgi:alkylhydroperoxidase family enzyme